MTTETKKNIRSIIFVMDESGSMRSMDNEPIDAINNFIEEQRKFNPNIPFTLYLFNDKVRKIYDNKALSTINKFTDYNPQDMTALYDAIGTAITDKLNTRDTNDVMFVIITDGEENASRKYRTQHTISKIIEKVEKEYNWQVRFLGANIDVFGTGNSLSIKRRHCRVYNQGEQGSFSGIMRDMSQEISEGISNGFREGRQSDF